MGEGQGQPGGAGGGGGGGGGFGDFMMNIGAPAAATVAAGFGPRYAASAAIGMSAVNNLSANKRRKKLGEKISRLADVKADADLKERTELYNKEERLASAMAPSDTGAVMMEGGFSGDPMKFAGEFAAKGLGVSEKRSKAFKDAVPEPVLNEEYTLAGQIAEGGDPQSAIDMLSDTDQNKNRIAEKAMDYFRQQSAIDKQNTINKEERETDRAIATSRYDSEKEERLARQKIEDDRHALGLVREDNRFATSSSLDRERLNILTDGQDKTFRSSQLNNIRGEIADIEYRMGQDLAEPEEIAAATAPLRGEYARLQMESTGATQIYTGEGELVTPGQEPDPMDDENRRNTDGGVGSGEQGREVETDTEALTAGQLAAQAAGLDPQPLDPGIDPTSRLNEHIPKEGNVDLERAVRVAAGDATQDAMELLQATKPGMMAQQEVTQKLMDMGYQPDAIVKAFTEISEGRGVGARLSSLFSGLNEQGPAEGEMTRLEQQAAYQRSMEN